MRVSRRELVVAGLAAPAIVGRSSTAFAAETRMVVELFTSQGCSSCPPADKLLTELAARPDVLAISMPVDYWDYLGWKDTLASPLHSKRQKAYSIARGDRQVYTPQAVVNGLVHALGSSLSAIEAAAIASRGRDGALMVGVDVREEAGDIRVSVSPMPGAAVVSGQVNLVKLRRRTEVAIGRGENTGRTITYVNVSRGTVPLGMWDGKAGKFALPKEKAVGEDADGYAVLVQAGIDGRPGALLGAARGPGL